MAFQGSAFQPSAFQTSIPEPPEPPTGGVTVFGSRQVEFPKVERRGKAIIAFTASGRGRIEWVLDDEAIRERVRAFLDGILD